MSSNPYWAAQDGDLLAAAMLEKVRLFTQRFIGSRDLERLEQSARMYYGTDEDGDFSWKIERKGSKRQIRSLKANEYGQAIQRKLSIVCGTPSGFLPVPVNNDERSLGQSLLARGLLDYYFSEDGGGIDEVCDEATEMALVLQSAWVDVDWNRSLGEPVQAFPGVSRLPRMDATGQNVTAVLVQRSGDLDVKAFLPTDAICEYESRKRKKDWVILRSWHNRYDLAAQLETDAAEQLAKQKIDQAAYEDMLSKADLVRGLSSASNTDDEQLIRALRLQLGQVQPIDEVPVLDLRHARCPALPNGRRARLVGYSILLESGDNPFADDAHPDDLGAYEMKERKRFGTTRSYSSAHDVLGKARAVDALTSIPYSNQAALGLNVIVTPAQSDLRLNKLKEGLVSLETKTPQTPPEVLQLCRTPPEVFPFRKDLRNEVGEGIGLTDQTQGRGSQQWSGARAALEDTQTQRNVSPLANARKRLRLRLANAAIRRLQKFGTTTRKLPLVVGAGKEASLRDFTGTKDLAQIDRIRVEETGPFATSVALRIEAAKDMMQIKSQDGRPTLNAEQYITLVSTGKFEPLTEGPMAEAQLIRAENEAISRGEILDQPPQLDPATGQPIPGTGRVTALWTDNPWLHMREHGKPVATLDGRSNPAVTAAHEAHNAAHLPFLLEWIGRSPRMIAFHGEPKDPYTGQPLMAPLAPPPGVAPGAPAGAPNAGPTPTPVAGPSPGAAQGRPAELPNLPRNPASGERYSPTGAVNG